MDGLSRPRYCETPFPPYRYVPGRGPHPTAHPDGHSFRPAGAAEHAAVIVPPERWRQSPDYLYGCDLYNHGYWWEAHEAWEALWQLTDKSDVQGRFLQALIQTAACHLKLFEGKREGVRSLRASSEGHARFVLERLPSLRFMGLNFGAWWSGVTDYYGRVRRGEGASAAHDPEHYPYIDLSG